MAMVETKQESENNNSQLAAEGSIALVMAKARSDEGCPAMSKVVMEMNKLTKSRSASVNELTQNILDDYAMQVITLKGAGK